jgi:hypothetical protein
MRATWRPLPAWPYPPSTKAAAAFRADWAQTMRDLGTEIERVEGEDVLIGIVAGDDQFLFDGTPKAGFQQRVKHPGAEISFTLPSGRRVTFHTDAFPTLQANLRAISNGLEALRAIDRYGITTSGEQYAGFQQLTAGGASADRGAALVAAAGGLTEALKKHHPDQGGRAAAFKDVQAYRKRAGF